MTPQERQQLNELIEWKRTSESSKLVMNIANEDTIRDRGFVIYTDKSASTVTEDASINVVIQGVKFAINVKKL